MSPLPDWLVERVALDEVPPASRGRIDRAEPELAERVAALREANERELAHHPAGPAIAQLADRIAAEARAQKRTRTRRGVVGLATSMAAVGLVAGLVVLHTNNTTTATGGESHRGVTAGDGDGSRVKGLARLLAFRQVGDTAEHLDDDALVRAGDVIQLRYNGGGKRFGVIASVDGAGVVTLHYPLDEAAPPEATAIAAGTLALPHAYQLDDAPRFERFFFVTADEPIDLQDNLAALRAFAHRDDAADGALELPPGLHQTSLRLRKPDATSHHESP